LVVFEEKNPDEEVQEEETSNHDKNDKVKGIF
jgi:hypothetical protein